MAIFAKSFKASFEVQIESKLIESDNINIFYWEYLLFGLTKTSLKKFKKFFLMRGITCSK